MSKGRTEGCFSNVPCMFPGRGVWRQPCLLLRKVPYKRHPLIAAHSGKLSWLLKTIFICHNIGGNKILWQPISCMHVNMDLGLLSWLYDLTELPHLVDYVCQFTPPFSQKKQSRPNWIVFIYLIFICLIENCRLLVPEVMYSGRNWPTLGDYCVISVAAT
jgi:hypothetical protein